MEGDGMKTVIIGGVAGGATCAARLRRLDENAQIVVLERGDYISFANCGLPYYIGGVIEDRDDLLLQTPEEMSRKLNIDVRIRHEVVAINREKKTLTVRRLETGEQYEESYDKLVISTGSSPLRPPIPGIDSPRVCTLTTLPDTDAIKRFIQDNARRAVVVGGGFIGLEAAENLHRAGLEVSIVELGNQVMPPLDFEMAQLLHRHLASKGVELYLGDGVAEFSDRDRYLELRLSSGRTIEADIVILSVGVRPNNKLARAAGLKIGERGGIVVNESMLTSDPDIYAVGDAAEVRDFVFGEPAMVPLAGPANKQGRVAANNIAGIKDSFSAVQGSAIVRVFNLTAAVTGTNEKQLTRRGLVRGRDYEVAIITQNPHAGYYPGARPMTLKLLFSTDGKKIFGAQIVGREGVDKRIDTIGTAMRLGASVFDLAKLEFAYSPPYSSAKDPVNMLGFVAGNVLSGKVRFCEWDAIENNSDSLLLDVREKDELKAFSLLEAVHIPLGELRRRADELDSSRHIIIMCAIGVRAYNAARILMQRGFENVSVYPGGALFYRLTHYGKTESSLIYPGPAAEDKQIPPA
jgi:NADPH-dependent 2,4-dienoyl-CoA reductase/sulfur reductase-like enzyme/rhodanese-related sulfurtransferase